MENEKGIEKFLRQNQKRTLLRFSTAGSVDDGKSTLIGRLLHDSKNIFEDTLASLRSSSLAGHQEEEIDFALLTDGLKAEREQKITIDVAYRYFSTPMRNFILADTPGHEQYTRNMATGASTADAAVVLIDARNGISTQSKRHSFILSLLGVRHIIVAINKMDLVDHSEGVFNSIAKEYKAFAARLGFANLHIIPMSALHGDNVVHGSKKMSWYHGPPLLEYLEQLYVEGDRNLIDLRLAIQGVIRPDQNFRGFIGQISSGILRKDDEVMVLPSMKRAKIKEIVSFDGSMEKAFAPKSVTFTLDREIDLGRGDLLCSPQNMPIQADDFEAMVVWMSETPMVSDKTYLIKRSASSSRGKIEKLRYKIDVNTLRRTSGDELGLNEIGRISCHCHRALFYDPYSKNPGTGNFILIDPHTNETLAAGMIVDRHVEKDYSITQENVAKLRNVTRQKSLVTREEREKSYGHKAKTIWLTGLSGSGKSSIAGHLERMLFDQGIKVQRLDGDNVRLGLNKDLGFSVRDRQENIRRVAEMAHLFNQAGLVAIVSFISPFRADRDSARKVIGEDRFVEIFVDAPLEVCEQRDSKGLYKRARAGEIGEFTGISSPYEPPENCDLHIQSDKVSIEDSVTKILYQFFDPKDESS